MVELRAVSLTAEPKIELVDAPPLTGELAARVEKHRAWLAQDPFNFDGPVVLCKSIDEIILTAYRSTYAVKLAIYELAKELRFDDYLEISLGPIAVTAVIADQDGATLWGRRAAQVFTGGSWHLMPSGMLEPETTPRELILREASEEIALDEDDFVSFEPAAIVPIPEIGVIQLLYQGQVTSRDKVKLNLEEHSELAWVADTAEITPILAEGLALHRAFFAGTNRS